MYLVDCNENHLNESNFNNVLQPLLTDYYQLTMAHAYWKNGKQDDFAVFDVFFRKNPFQGEFTVFAGLNEILHYLKNFKFSQCDIEYIRQIFPPNTEEEFFTYLSNLTVKDITLYAMKEGTICFPREPLIRIEGPLAIAQLLETILLTLVNYSSLVATNAARHRIASDSLKEKDKNWELNNKRLKLFEMGLRRAQGPDGALSASRYSFLGGFDGTSNVLAGKLYDIPLVGTHAHSFVMSYSSLDEISKKQLKNLRTSNDEDFLELCIDYRIRLESILNAHLTQSNDGEFASFIAYAISFPNNFAALIDTYDVLKSGILNYCSVVLSLIEFGYKPIGCRIDSGDLAYLSIEIHSAFIKIKNAHRNQKLIVKNLNHDELIKLIDSLDIIASGDIDEELIYSLNEQGHKLTALGIGTKLVTCQKQSALGAVYKLVEVNKKPCIKLSSNVEKVTIPCRKQLYRLYSADGTALNDLMTQYEEKSLVDNLKDNNERILCRHPFIESKRAYVTPKKKKPLLEICNPAEAKERSLALKEAKKNFQQSLNEIREDTLRHINPTPFKVSVTANLYTYMHELWLESAPVGELF